MSADVDDFVVKSGRIHFAPGETEKNITLQIKGDSAIEPDEVVSVMFANRAGLSFDEVVVHGVKFNILNDDVQPIKLSLWSFEENGGFYLNWNQAPQRMLLQSSMNLVDWSNVAPTVGSNETGPFKIERTEPFGLFRFGP